VKRLKGGWAGSNEGEHANGRGCTMCALISSQLRDNDESKSIEGKPNTPLTRGLKIGVVCRIKECGGR
jgi:hypothetical protein